MSISTAIPEVAKKSYDDYKISDVGNDVPIIVNEAGGMQSKLQYRFDLFDPATMFELAKVTAYGAEKYGDWNWRKIPVNDHINHALTHIYAYMLGNKDDDHLRHAFCRIMFALSLDLALGEVERMKP